MGDSLVEDVLSYFDPASLVLLSSSSSANYCSSLDHLERGDSKLPEVIYIDDSPQLEEISSVSGETITPCPSISEDDGGVQEIFVSSRPLSLLDRDGIEEVNNSNFELSSTRTPTKETPLEESTAKDRLCYVQDEDHTDSLSIVQSRIPLRNFIIPCLQTVNTLKSRYGSRYKLNVKLRKVAGVRPKKFRTKLYKFKKDLHQELDDWEAYLNEQSPNEAYIAVENTVDNEGPPRDFTYITHNILHQDISHLFDINYLVGCSCKRVCTRETCECPSNSGGKFAYDRSGKVLVEPGTPIYECNSRCPCGLSCRNRVVQRGRTVKVAIFRTPNGCGWGVKTMDPIEKNQLVTEYVGEAITQEEAEERGKVYDSCGSTYLFDLDFNAGECLYTLDAKKYGNISHFVNHSCDPNLSVYAIWVDTLDPNFPRIALVASRDIKVGEELTFDYQMTSSEVSGSGCSPRKRNNIRCHCGAENCRTYLC